MGLPDLLSPFLPLPPLPLVLLVWTGSHYVAVAQESLTLSVLPPQPPNDKITGMCHHVQPAALLYFFILYLVIPAALPAGMQAYAAMPCFKIIL